MLIHKERLSGTVASNTLTITTSKFSGIVIHHIYVKPATATNTYNITIKDADQDILYSNLSVEGTLDVEVEIPTRGTLTVALTSVATNEAFTGYLGVRE